MKKLISILLMELMLLTPVVQAKGKIQNEDVKSLTELTNDGGSASQLINDSKIYVTANGINSQLSTAITNQLIGGSGSGSGINLLLNPGFETGVSQGWSNTGGTFAAISSGSNLLVGKGSATFQASGSGQLAQSSLFTVPNGLYGASCAASVLYKGGDANLKLQVTDGTNVLSERVLSPSTGPTTTALSFICPSTGQLRLKLVSTASSALIALDETFLGKKDSIQVSQASLYGSLYSNASAGLYSNTASFDGFGNQFASYGGNNPSPIITGGISSLDGANMAITMNNLPPGNYQVIYQAAFRNNASGTLNHLLLTDGTDHPAGVPIGMGTSSGSSAAYSSTLQAVFSYTSGKSSVTITPIASGSGQVNLDNYSLPMNIYVYRYPLSSELAFSPELKNWNVDATIQGTMTMNATALATYGPGVLLDQASDVVLVNRSTGGNAPSVQAMIPCAGAEAPSGTTCVSNNETVGVAFAPPAGYNGRVEVCADFSSYINTGGGTASQTFRLDHYNSTLSGLIASGEHSADTASSGTNSRNTEYPIHLCETFNVTNSSVQSFVLSWGSIVGQAIGAQGLVADAVQGRNVHFTVKPVTEGVVPYFPGNTTTPNTQAQTSIASATISGGSVSYSSGNWITSVSNPSVGYYTINFVPGVFSTTANNVTCTCNGNDNGPSGDLNCYIESINSTLVSWHLTSGTTALDIPTRIICHGDK